MNQTKRGRAGDDISDLAWAFLNDAVPEGTKPCMELWQLQFDYGAGEGVPGHTERPWRRYRNAVLEAWVEQWSGRPSLWWQYDAPRQPLGTYPGRDYDGKLPEPRRRLGGIGTPAFEVLANAPRFAYGMPVDWIDQWTADYYNGVTKDINGNPANGGSRTKPFRGVPVDLNDPPRYESEASYLDRHGLFMPGERERMTAEDWEPEVVEGTD